MAASVEYGPMLQVVQAVTPVFGHLVYLLGEDCHPSGYLPFTNCTCFPMLCRFGLQTKSVQAITAMAATAATAHARMGLLQSVPSKQFDILLSLSRLL